MNSCIGNIHSIESMGLVDGPGIRTVVFMQGCRLRCRYCHNPDTWAMQTGREMQLTPQQLVNRLVRYKSYYGDNGGVTFSGGEPLLQPEFLLECLQLCRIAGIHTCIDTAGCGVGHYRELLRYTDLVLLDIKHCTAAGYRLVTGQQPDEFQRFLFALQESGTPLWLRHVVVPGLTDGETHLEEILQYVKTLQNVQRVELLPYHTLGAAKYEKLGIPYPLAGLAPLSPDSLYSWQQRFDRVFSPCGPDSAFRKSRRTA